MPRLVLVGPFVGEDAAVRRAEDDKANHVHEWIIKNEICVQSLGGVALYQRMIVCFTLLHSDANYYLLTK